MYDAITQQSPPHPRHLIYRTEQNYVNTHLTADPPNSHGCQSNNVYIHGSNVLRPSLTFLTSIHHFDHLEPSPSQQTPIPYTATPYCTLCRLTFCSSSRIPLCRLLRRRRLFRTRSRKVRKHQKHRPSLHERMEKSSSKNRIATTSSVLVSPSGKDGPF